jgi:hypothetical protein
MQQLAEGQAFACQSRIYAADVEDGLAGTGGEQEPLASREDLGFR